MPLPCEAKGAVVCDIALLIAPGLEHYGRLSLLA